MLETEKYASMDAIEEQLSEEEENEILVSFSYLLHPYLHPCPHPCRSLPPPVARHHMRTVHHAVHRPYDTHGACLASQRGASHPGGVCDTDGQHSGARRAARLTTRGSLRPPTLLRRRLEAAAEGLQRESQ